MAGKVTSLRFQKRTQERVNVYIDDKFAFGLPALEAAKLHVGQELSDADIERLRAEDAAQKAYDRALRFLSYRPRSRAEVERKLLQVGVDEALVASILARLTERGYLNDLEFARFWVDNRERFKPRGTRALRYELRQKGLDDGVIAAALTDLDMTESAYRAGQTRASRLAGLAASDPATFRRKMSEFLLRRGFAYGVIRDVVSRFEQEAQAEADQSSDEG